MRILITDGNERTALAAARSLVQAGHAVSVASPTRVSLAGVSRGVESLLVARDPLLEPANFVADLAAIASRGRVDLLLPVTDPSVEAVLEYRASLPDGLCVPFPDLPTFRAASDKARLLGLAEKSGFAVPETRILESPDPAGGIPGPEFFPAVVKPHRSVVSDGGIRRKLGVTPVADVGECRQALSTLPAAAYPVLLQRRVSGVGEGLFVLRWNGRTVALFAHRRLREKPPGGGVSVYRESIALEEDLVSPGLRLLDQLGWQGVAMIECKREEGTGRQVIMEVNGRFWGSLQLAIDAGVDFPALLVRCAAGDIPPETRQYRVGVRSRWFWGDVDHLYLRFKGSMGSPLGAILDFLRVWPGRDRNEIWRWRDPRPFLIETLQWLRILPRTVGAKR